MKVTEVRAIPLAVPLDEGTPRSAWAAGVGKQILVRVATDEDLTGWGECFAYGAPSAVAAVVDEALAPLVLGEDPTRIEDLAQKLQRALMIWGRRGLAMFAVSGVELALWDLAGKGRGVPVYELLGGLVRPSLPAYASLLRYATPAEVAGAAAAAVARGYRAVKLHQVDVESVAAARDAVGRDVELMLDTNCPWSVGEAIRIGRELEPFALRWLEEPVWPPEDYAGLARVRAAVGIPIACGENEATLFGFQAIVAAGAADVVQPSATKVGGLSEMRKVAALAEAAGVTLAPHAYYFGPGLAATLHFAAATAGVPYVEFPPGELAAPLLGEPIRCADGAVTVPARPGLGADPDPDTLARHPYRRERARPFYLA
jgi:L-alanine-DL-glutamate epimerase-like enolase superfamily enzyme